MLENMFVFAAVVEHQSLNKASRILNISQPALSRKISSLEEQLGVQLFQRKGKRLELTRIGQITYEYALELRGLQQRLFHTIGEFKAEGKSSITIGASLTTLQSTLPDLITFFTADSPGTDIKAITGKTHEIVMLVKEKKVDVGLVASRIDHPDLNCVPMFDDHLSLVLPKNYFIKRHGGFTINDLNQLPMILFSKGTWYRILTDELFHRYAIFPDVKMEIDSFEAILRLVSTCKVATLLPKSYLRQSQVDDNELAVFNIPELEQTTRTTSLIYGELSTLNATTRRLIEKAILFFKKTPNDVLRG